jgi:hypothetical protein
MAHLIRSAAPIPAFEGRVKKRRSVSTLSIPRASDRGVEWVDLNLANQILNNF